MARKAMPMLAYAAELNTIPKQQLAALATEVATVLWDGRPSWRLRELLLAVVHRGHLVHPEYALAYRAVLNVVSHLQRSEVFAIKWRIAFTNPRVLPSTLVASFVAFRCPCVPCTGFFSGPLPSMPISVLVGPSAVTFVWVPLASLMCPLPGLPGQSLPPQVGLPLPVPFLPTRPLRLGW